MTIMENIVWIMLIHLKKTVFNVWVNSLRVLQCFFGLFYLCNFLLSSQCTSMTMIFNTESNPSKSLFCMMSLAMSVNLHQLKFKSKCCPVHAMVAQWDLLLMEILELSVWLTLLEPHVTKWMKIDTLTSQVVHKTMIRLCLNCLLNKKFCTASRNRMKKLLSLLLLWILRIKVDLMFWKRKKFNKNKSFLLKKKM